MENVLKVLTDICVASLNDKPFDGVITDEKNLYMIAKENGLVGLIFNMLKHDQISPRFLSAIQKDYYAYIANDIKQMDAIKNIDDLFNQNEIKHIFLKGSRIKRLYPESYMRGMGDIDILIEEKNMPLVHQLFKEKNIILDIPSEQHDLFIMDQSITIEIHPKLYKDFNPNYEVLMKDPWQYTYQINAFEFGLNYEFEIIYLTYHLAKHLNAGGIGLRSLLDIGIYLNFYQNQIDEKRLKDMLKLMDIDQFFSHLIYLNMKHFQFNHLVCYTCVPPLSDRRYDEITQLFVESGIHGKGSQFNPFEARYSIHKNKQRKSFSFYLGIFFPPYKTMKGSYPILNHWKILLPFTWFLRWMRLLFKNTKSSFHKMKLLGMKKQKVDLISDIYKDLGL